MTLKLSSDSQELQTSVRRFLEEQCSNEYVRGRFESRSFHDGTLLSAIQELGLTPYFAEPESKFRDLSLIAFECGRVLLPESLIDATFGGPFLFSKLLTPEAQDKIKKSFNRDILEEIKALKSSVAIAPPELSLTTALERRNAGNCERVSGVFRYVAGADIPNFLIFPTTEGILIADLYTGKEQRCEVTEIDQIDRTERRFAVNLSNVAVVNLGLTTEKFSDLYYSLKACELAGVMSKVVEMTVEYVKTRKQFDSPIGTFQAVQHKLADMHLQAEACRSLADFSAWAADHSPEQLNLSAHAAISFATENAPTLVENAIQLHGGIGFTWEHNLHFYLRRAKVLSMLFATIPGKLVDIASAD